MAEANTIFWFISILLACWIAFRFLTGGCPKVSPQAAYARVAEGKAVLVDVREPDEWRSGIAAPAHTLAFSRLQSDAPEWSAFLEEAMDKEILLYCHSGMRSAMAARLLARKQYRVGNVGAFHQWKAAGYPVKSI